MCIKIQSAKHDCDFLEYRINEFLMSREEGFTAEGVESNKQSIINEFMQKKTSLDAEAKLNWGQILKHEYDFDRRKQ